MNKHHEEDSNISPDQSNEPEMVEAKSPDEANVISAVGKMEQKNPEMMESFLGMMASGPMPNPIAEKITEDHITSALKLANDHDKRQYLYSKTKLDNDHVNKFSERKWHFAYFGVIVLVVMVLVAIFKDQPEILVPLLTGVGGCIGGFLGGVGYSRSKSDS